MKKQALSLMLALVLTIAFVPAFSTTAQAAEPWQDAYAKHLNGKTGEFFLYDIDKDGTPELFWEDTSGSVLIYTYNNGIKELGPFYWHLTVYNSSYLYCQYGADDTGRLSDGYLAIENGAIKIKNGQPAYRDTADVSFFPITDANIQKHIGSTATSPGNPHFYATELRKFMDGAKGKTSAILYDIDGCGNEEVIAFDSGKVYTVEMIFTVADGGKVTVFDAKTQTAQSIAVDYTLGSFWLYISNKNYLSVSGTSIDFFDETVYKYKDGILVKEVVLENDINGYGNGTPYTINGTGSTKSQYESKRNEYGLGNAAVTITVGEGYLGQSKGTLRDDTAKILAMTSTPSTTLDTASGWAKDGITQALSKGFIPSDLQNNYQNVIARAEFCRMAVKFVEYKTGKNIDAILTEKGLSRNPNAFTDTSDPDILAAAALGITAGTGGGLFTPNGQFSREQAATMIRNTCKAAGMDISNVTTAGFEDIGSASTWAVDGINFVRNNGIMSGTSTTPLLFSPKGTYTREQSIITFNNIK